MTKDFFNDIKTQLQTVDADLYVRLWRNQFDEIEQGENYSFPNKSCFVEFINSESIKQMGNGLQLFDPLIVRLHIGLVEYDSGDGNLDQNLTILDLKEAIYFKMQKFEPNKASLFIRVDEQMHSEHNQVSVFTQDYKTTLVDSTAVEPINGTTTAPPTTLVINTTI